MTNILNAIYFHGSNPFEELIEAYENLPMIEGFEKLFMDAKAGTPFKVHVAAISEKDASQFVRVRYNPAKFVASMFNGDWSIPTEHPMAGELRLLSIVKDTHNISRLLGRQGKFLYAYPK